MYISAFHIDGFGLYSNVSVNNLPAGISIFLGRNEAGKSTCLEFLRVMLTGDKKNRVWKRFAPISGGICGGAITLQCQGDNGRDEQIDIFRKEGTSELYMRAGDGRNLQPEILERLLGGVNSEVYRKVFGFSLSELERFDSLSADEVRNALYGASFGPALVSPAEVSSALTKEMDKIFKPGGTKPNLNVDLAEYGDLREKISSITLSSSTYDALSLELDAKKEQRDNLRAEKNDLENERRKLEKRPGLWRKWEQWRLLGERLASLPSFGADFPEDAETRLARLQESRENAAKSLEARKLKLQRLREQRDELAVDENLLETLPELKRLAERKNSYRQAITQLSGQRENSARAKADMEYGLSQLGPGWDCGRIKQTDRSLFTRQDLEKQAQEMQAAIASRKTTIDYLNKINSDVANCEEELEKAAQTLEAIPEVSAVLDDQQRDELRQNMARLEESRRLEPGRERALDTARNAFNRAFEHLGLETPPKDESGHPEHAAAKKLVDGVLEKQADGMEIAEEMGWRLEEAAEINRKIHHSESTLETLKRKFDEIRARQRGSNSPRRDTLEAKTVALRSLRSVAANIAAEKERIEELDARIKSIEPPARIGSWALLFFGLFFLLGAAAIFAAHWFWALTEIDFGPDFTIPINVWAGYGSLVCGVAFLAGALPGNGSEQRKRAAEMAQLRSRRETSAAHLAEMENQGTQLCATVGVDSMDAITLDATEMLLEREKEQCFHEELALREISALRAEYTREQENKNKLLEESRKKESEAQECRMRWHSLMQGLHVSIVPSPESAPTFFAKVESARLAYENVANAQTELDALLEDLGILESAMSQLAPIAEQLENSAETPSIETAAQLALDSCREADQIQERRQKAQQNLQTLQKELARAQTRQQEAAAQLREADDKEKTARENWSSCLDGLGLGSELDPETVRQAFKYMENCLDAEDRWLRSQREVENGEAELAAMREPMEAIMAKIGQEPVRDSDNNPDWLATLDTLLPEAEKSMAAQKEKERLKNDITEAEEELGLDDTAFTNARVKIEALLNQAQCDNEDDFLKLARQHAERLDLARRIDDLELDLKTGAGDEPVDAFLESFRSSSEHGEEERLSFINSRLDEIRDQENELINAIGALSGRRESMASTNELAVLRQDEAMLLENMRQKALLWSRYALAKEILMRAKSVFEKERQPEVIKLASEIFAKITGGRWSGLGASLEEKSLVIIAPDGSTISPDKLSRGAQEQAYLALRLAYIRNHARESTPLPVIMDEILVNFDPERAERTAQVIGDFSRGHDNKTQQIFYFTCQPAMAEMLKNAAPGAPIYNVRDGAIALAG